MTMARHKDPRYFFYKKTFYLDLKHFRGEVDLIKDIKRFGGKVESFLSKDVNYVISDRPEAKPKIDPSYPETPGSLAPLMSPTELYKSPYGFMPSPAPSSPFNERGKGTVTSRGLALVQKARQKSEGTGDVLGICSQWKIKVFHIQVITFVLNKLKNIYGKKRQERAESRVLVELSRSPQLKLSVPFVKVEDDKKQYRTHYKELRHTDTIFKSDLSRAVRKVHEDFHHGDLNPENPSSSVLKEVNSPRRDQASPITVNFTPVIHKNFSTPSVFKKQFGSKMGLLNDSKENHVNGSKGLGNESKENSTKFPSLKRKKDCKGSSNSTKREKKHRKQKYCEICQEQFADLEVHISSNKHQNYVNDSINHGDLHKVISTLSSLDSFMKKIAKQRQERMLQQSEFKSHKSHIDDPVEDYHNDRKPRSGRTPLLNCEENFSDCTKGIQLEPEKTGTDNIPGGHDNGVLHLCNFQYPVTFDAGIGDLENWQNPLVNPLIKPESSAHCNDFSNDAYNAVTEEYVSASCSTDDSNMLAYLENSADNLVSCKEDPFAQNVSPALLVKESPVIDTKPPLIDCYSPFTHTLRNAVDFTGRIEDLNHGNVSCPLQIEMEVKNELSQNNDHSSSTALDLSLPPPVLSPIDSYRSSSKRKPYSFSVNKAKRLKFDTGANATSGLPTNCDDEKSCHFDECKNEISLSYNTNHSISSQVPDLSLSLKNVLAAVNSDARSDNENHKHSNSLDCAPLLSPMQSCFESRVSNRDEEATRVNENELDVCPKQNMKDYGKSLESKICTELQPCAKSLSSFAVCTPEPSVQGDLHQTKEPQMAAPSLSHSLVARELLLKDETVESCDRTLSNGANNAGPVGEVIEENDQQISCCLMNSTSAANVNENSAVEEKCNVESGFASLPILQCCIHNENCQLESITVDMPVLEPNAIGTPFATAILAQELNACSASSVLLTSNLEDLQSAQKQDWCLETQTGTVNADIPYSFDTGMTVECTGEILPPNPDILCMDNNEPVCLTAVRNSAVSKLPDSQDDVNDHHERDTVLGEDGKQPQLSVMFLPRCSSESFDSQKDTNECKYYDYCKAMPFDWEADLKVSSLATQNNALCNTTLNFSIGHSSGGVESVIASGSADVSKWVSECDISSDSEPDWGNLKSNVDSLCQDLDKLNSESEIGAELPLNLALI